MNEKPQKVLKNSCLPANSENFLTPFPANIHVLYPLKTLENGKSSDAFCVYKKDTLT